MKMTESNKTDGIDTNDYNCDVTDEEVNAMVKNIKAYMIYNGWIPKLF